jgi:hypothetical protein
LLIFNELKIEKDGADTVIYYQSRYFGNTFQERLLTIIENIAPQAIDTSDFI